MKGLIRRFLAWLGYRIEGVRFTPRQLFDPAALRNLELADVICRHMHQHGEECVFLQIGAYDGISTDPLRHFIHRCGWRGVMVEPQPGPASQLGQLYPEGSGITIIQAAVDAQRGTRSLFTAESDDLPRWVGGMASFNRENLLKHADQIEGIADMIREIEVPAITIEDALAALPSDRIDVLQIDVEGADGFVLSLFPFSRIRPAIVHWEIKNMDRAQQEAAIDLMLRHGYRIARSGSEDMMAILERAA